MAFYKRVKFEVVAAAENNPNARKTYKRNHKVARLYSDVCTIDYAELLESVGPIDIVIGGPPCQDFSISIKNLRNLRISEVFLRLYA